MGAPGTKGWLRIAAVGPERRPMGRLIPVSQIEKRRHSKMTEARPSPVTRLGMV